MIVFKDNVIFYLFLSCFTVSTLFSAQEKTHSEIDGLVGTYPAKIRYVCNDLKRVKAALEHGDPLPRVFKNRLLLYGAPGNGKTTLARKIAEQADWHIEYLNAPEIVSKYIGVGADNIKKVFDDARTHIDKYGTPVVIIIDEIDVFTVNLSSEERAEHKAIAQELWLQLDSIKHDPRLYFICTTNSDDIHDTLKTRFGNNVYELTAPDASAIRSLLQTYKMNYTGTYWEESTLECLVSISQGYNLSIRFFEDFVEEVCLISEHDYAGEITKNLAQDVFYEMKDKYIDGWFVWAKKEFHKNKREITTRIVQAAVIAAVGMVFRK